MEPRDRRDGFPILAHKTHLDSYSLAARDVVVGRRSYHAPTAPRFYDTAAEVDPAAATFAAWNIR
ncbi:MAG TPA: hypothetical protein VF188_17690 [Longimicrobiales bacterium]